jgi:hypothetical protein
LIFAIAPQKMQTILSRSIDFFSQPPTASKRHYLPFWLNQVFTSSRVPAFAFRFLFHAEFTKPTDQDIFTRFKCVFHGANN